eukprot:TRINITY_DN1170_c0_g1_i2.p1 TRINITY_DN1170_c0_g1~~TRINITY_DN1170_c0_g1_i2.p1  ORF type:complete len:311 (-),score=42.85 TRINITY_DN1170_c0_g1_i2:91-1023(-)
MAMNNQQNTQFTSSLSQDLYELLMPSENADSSMFSDVTFRVDGQPIFAHKVIISARSKFFRSFFKDKGMYFDHSICCRSTDLAIYTIYLLLDSKNNINSINCAYNDPVDSHIYEIKKDLSVRIVESSEIFIEGCSFNTFKDILHWIYTDQIMVPIEKNIDVKNWKVWDLWEVAQHFSLEDLLKLLEEHILQNLITEDNICSLWNYVDILDNARIKSLCQTYFVDNLEIVVNSSGFLQLERKLLAEVFFEKDNTPPPQASVKSQMMARFKTLALTRWFAAHEPLVLKRKFPYPNFQSNKKLKVENSMPNEL